MTTTIKWLIAHEPVHLFVRTAQYFADELRRESGGRFDVEILTVDDYKTKYCNDEFDVLNDLFDHVEAGKIDMTQTTVSRYGRINSNFFALDLPFLFDSHEHATRVYEGPIGKALCEGLSDNSNMQGLAFTYSGGWRIMGSAEEINSIADFAGKPVRCNDNPVTYLTLKGFGAAPMPEKEVGSVYDHVRDGIYATESTYIRFKGTHVFKSSHSLFMTTIVMSKEIWGTLSAADQEMIHAITQRVAKVERQWSVDDAAEFEKNCVENGVTITYISPEDDAELRRRAERVYEESAEWFHPDIVTKIKQA